MPTPRNLGEQNEVFIKAFLLMQQSISATVSGFGRIQSLDFGPGVDVPLWKPAYSELLSSRNYSDLKAIIPKASRDFKADIGINGRNYSLKFSGSAKSAIVNHTNRKGFLRVCNEINVPIEPLDQLIQEYWVKREVGTIMEDVSNTNTESPFKESKEYFRAILEYFIFKGTGSKESAFQADFLLDFSDAFNPESYTILGPDDVIDNIWETLVFSVRSKKGMPTRLDPLVHGEIMPWVRYRPGDLNPKGALHVRN